MCGFLGCYTNHQNSRPYLQRVRPRQEGITIPRTRRGREKKARALRVLPFMKPSREYSTPPQAQGLHPPGALVRTHWQVRKSPRRLYSNHSGAQGLLSGTNTRVPKEEELMTINIDSSARSRARLRLSPGSASFGHRGRGPCLV